MSGNREKEWDVELATFRTVRIKAGTRGEAHLIAGKMTEDEAKEKAIKDDGQMVWRTKEVK